MPDGTIMGDPIHVEMTKIAINLGWTPKYGRYDVLPVIACADGQEPVWKDVPKDCYTEVKITHPTYEWFSELNLSWYEFGEFIGIRSYRCLFFLLLLGMILLLSLLLRSV